MGMRIAVIGTGISGIAAAHALSGEHEVTLFEAEDRPGGHTHTVSVEVEGTTVAVDTGFLVYTEATYPGLTRFFAELGVVTQPSDMSFSVTDEDSGLEWRGTDLKSVFAQPRNLANPAFLAMLVDVVRFNRLARTLLTTPASSSMSLGDLLATRRWSKGFTRWYLVPLGASIWSSSPESFLSMPAVMLARFLDRHGLLSFGDKPAWRTVTGGAKHYVDAALAPFAAGGRLHLGAPITTVRREDDGVELVVAGSSQVHSFDHVVVAVHSDQALAMMADATPAEKEILGAIRYQDNDVTLHTDASFLPKAHRAWAAWNYHQTGSVSSEIGVTMTYYLNALQGLGVSTPVLETLNRHDEVDPSCVLARFSYAHPVLDTSAVAAQARRHEISGPAFKTSYAGAYWANGFHEDGFQSGLAAAAELGSVW